MLLHLVFTSWTSSSFFCLSFLALMRGAATFPYLEHSSIYPSGAITMLVCGYLWKLVFLLAGTVDQAPSQAHESPVPQRCSQNAYPWQWMNLFIQTLGCMALLAETLCWSWAGLQVHHGKLCCALSQGGTLREVVAPPLSLYDILPKEHSANSPQWQKRCT